MDLVAVFGEIENLGAAGKSLAANKVAGTELWRRKGFKSAAAWLASTTGTGMGDAVNALTTAAALQGLDATTESYTSGKLSPRQAKAVATAAAADPNAEQELLATAASAPVTDLEAKAREIRIAASPESAEQRHARVHAERHVRTWVDDDAGYGQWKFTLADHARFVALLDAQKDRIFRTARSEGRREPDQAYAADALLSLLDAGERHAGALDRRAASPPPTVGLTVRPGTSRSSSGSTTPPSAAGTPSTVRCARSPASARFRSRWCRSGSRVTPSRPPSWSTAPTSDPSSTSAAAPSPSNAPRWSGSAPTGARSATAPAAPGSRSTTSPTGPPPARPCSTASPPCAATTTI